MSLSSQRAANRAQFECEIIAAASAEFVRHGFEGFSLRKLAKRTGCAPGTLYLYFKNKQALLDRVVEVSFRKLLDSLEAIPPAADVLAPFSAYVKFGLNHPDLYRCAFTVQTRRRGSGLHPSFDFLRERVRIGAAHGVFRLDDVELIAQVLWAAAHGLTSLLIARPGFPWASRERLIRETGETVLRGLLVPERLLSRVARSKRAASPT